MILDKVTVVHSPVLYLILLLPSNSSWRDDKVCWGIQWCIAFSTAIPSTKVLELTYIAVQYRLEHSNFSKLCCFWNILSSCWRLPEEPWQWVIYCKLGSTNILITTSSSNAIKYYLLNLSYNPGRFDSWAGLALAKSRKITHFLNVVSDNSLCKFMYVWSFVNFREATKKWLLASSYSSTPLPQWGNKKAIVYYINIVISGVVKSAN